MSVTDSLLRINKVSLTNKPMIVPGVTNFTHSFHFILHLHRVLGLVTRLAISIPQYMWPNWIDGLLACMCDWPKGISGCQLMLTGCYL